jgi:hypothetical protein
MMRALKTIMLTGTAFAMLAAAPPVRRGRQRHSLNGHSLTANA